MSQTGTAPVEDTQLAESERRIANSECAWLDPSDQGAVHRALVIRGWLDAGEQFLSCEKAGEGNMNLTLRIRTQRRSVVLKQARPWVEKYAHIPAPSDRVVYEQKFYQAASELPEVAARMPRLLGCDVDSRLLLLEDVGERNDMSDLYRGTEVRMTELEELARYLRALHDARIPELHDRFANTGMRKLNHEHIFRVPLNPGNGIDLEQFESGLTVVARELQADPEFVRCVQELGRAFLADGPCLVHGDFFPGSWLRSAKGIRIIDPEFCFCGDSQYDLGCAIGHLILANQPRVAGEALLDFYGGGHLRSVVAETAVVRYAAVEIARRILGVAQLPIPPSTTQRRDLIRRSRKAMVLAKWEILWR